MLSIELLQKIFSYVLRVEVEIDEEIEVERVKRDCISLMMVCREFHKALIDQISRMKVYDFNGVMRSMFKDCAHNYDLPSFYYYFEYFVEAYSKKKDVEFFIPIDRCVFCGKLRMVQSNMTGWCCYDVYQCCGGWHCKGCPISRIIKVSRGEPVCRLVISDEESYATNV